MKKLLHILNLVSVKSKSKLFIPVLILLIGLISGCQPVEDKTNESVKPNIILIMADDMGYESLGSYGSAEYQTPNLDRMAREGIKFNHFYSQPLCTPSRVKIMTGKYNFHNYTHFGYLNPEEKTFGNLFKENGYQTLIVGKWQLNGLNRNNPGNQDKDRPYEFGFDEYCLWQLTKRRSEGERFADPLLEQNGEVLDDLEDQYGPDIFRDYLLDFMERKKDSSFFIYFPMVLVHEPFVPTPDSEEWADPGLRYENDTSFYADMMAYTDKILGQIVQKTEELGIADNTFVLFTADNGTHPTIYSDMVDGTTIRGGKGRTVETGIRVPAVAYWKDRISQGREIDHLISFDDILPTLTDMAGISLEGFHTDGKSFLPLLVDGTYQPKDYLYEYYYPRWGRFDSAEYVWNHEYKLYKNGEFYRIAADRLEKDPLNTENLSPDEQKLKERFESVLNEMEQRQQ